MYYRKAYERCFEMTTMSCVIYEYKYPGNKIPIHLPRTDTLECELLELERPECVTTRKSKRPLMDVVLTNYFEHDIHVKGSVKFRLKIERCTYRDKVPDVVVFKSRMKWEYTRNACFVFTRHGKDAPMLLNNI
jgi:hypothetical protein